MARRASAPDARAAEAAARRRRARERAERDRRRSGGVQRAPREAPTPGMALAVGERREGLTGWTARAVASIPRAAARIASEFAHEVVGVMTSSVRVLVRPLSPLRAAASVLATLLSAARSTAAQRLPGSRMLPSAAGTAVAARPPRSQAELRARARRRQLLRRRLRMLLAAALAVSTLLAWIFVPASDAFRIRHVEVTGASAVGDLEARTQVDELLRGRTVFTVDEERLVERLEELPFVRSARVERHLPGGLQLHIVEYRPLALGYGDRRFWLVARDGRILARADRREWKGRVPMVTLEGKRLEPGMRISREPALQVLAARQPGSTLVFESVRAEKFRVSGRLAGGVEVRFGRADQLRQKVLVAELMLRVARRGDLDLVYIDVSVPSRPAICPRTSSGCLVPRRGTGEEHEAGQDDGSATTPEERGGDEAIVDAAAAKGAA